MKRNIGFWAIQGPGWLLLVYLIYAQAIPAFGYDLGVAMGTQEPAEKISDVGAAFWYGFAFADLLIYIPLLAAGLIGYWLGLTWGRICLVAALGLLCTGRLYVWPQLLPQGMQQAGMLLTKPHTGLHFQ